MQEPDHITADVKYKLKKLEERFGKEYVRNAAKERY